MKIFCIKELWKNDASSNAIFFNFTDLAFLPLFFAYKIFLFLDCWAFRYSFFLLTVRKEVRCTLFWPRLKSDNFLCRCRFTIQGTKWFGVHIFRLVLAMWVHIIVRRRLSKFISSFTLKLKFKPSRPTHDCLFWGILM